MTAIRRPKRASIPATVWIFIIGFVIVVFVALLPSSDTTSTTPGNHDGLRQGAGGDVAVSHGSLGQKLKEAVQSKRQALQKALAGLTQSGSYLPIARLKTLREKHQIIGERLIEIQQGKETVNEILQGEKTKQQRAIVEALQHLKKQRKQQKQEDGNLSAAEAAARKKKLKLAKEEASDKPPMELKEITDYLNNWIHQLHETLAPIKHATFEGIWQAYHDLTVQTLYPWDQEYLQRMPQRRKDGSIFLSLASYRDEHCSDTLYNAYAKAENPERLFVGLVQQNCHAECRSGVLSNLSMVPVEPDEDCHKAFCESDLGKEHCSQVRLLDIDEPESLGPYAARYFASKLWNGESWYMQIDAHMTFAQHWDSISLDMLHKAPSEKPVLSHYPPSHQAKLDSADRQESPASRLCGPVFATSDLENQIIRLEGGGVWDKVKLDTPAFAPFTAAGYFVSHSNMLREVPFDPFLPWIFMGEEIIMSSRLWTAGYDIFSPSRSVVGHWYVRRHKPKFWESVHRAFTNGVHNPLQMLVLDRIKYQLTYPEAALDVLPTETRSILTAVESYTMGTKRSLKRYLQLVGLNMTTKQVTMTEWCEKGYPPPGFEQYDHLYPDGVNRKTINLKLLADNEEEEEDESNYDDDGAWPDDDATSEGENADKEAASARVA